MTNVLLLLTAIIIFVTTATVVHGADTREPKEYSMTTIIDPGEEQCYYEDVAHGAVVEVEFQVISGGNLDIDYYIIDAEGVRLDQQCASLISLFLFFFFTPVVVV